MTFWIPLSLACAISVPAIADERDPWFGRDKAAHFSAGLGIASASYAVASTQWARGTSFVVGFGAGTLAGAAKETLDLAGLGDPSWKDFLWTASGAVVGTLIAWGLDLAFGGVSRERPAFAF